MGEIQYADIGYHWETDIIPFDLMPFALAIVIVAETVAIFKAGKTDSLFKTGLAVLLFNSL